MDKSKLYSGTQLKALALALALALLSFATLTADQGEGPGLWPNLYRIVWYQNAVKNTPLKRDILGAFGSG